MLPPLLIHLPNNMKRYAANKIYLSEDIYYTNAIIELDDNHTLTNVMLLSDSLELHSTPFFNGIILPFNASYCKTHLQNTWHESLHAIFNHQVLKPGDNIPNLSLLSGKLLLSQEDLRNIQIENL